MRKWPGSIRQTKYNLHKVLNKELERLYKGGLFKKTIAQAKDAEPLRLMGGLLTANIYRLKRHDRSYGGKHDPTNGLITIP